MSHYIHDLSVRKRLFWIKEAQRLGVNQACLKLGIYKSHFYYWKKRYDLLGLEGLKAQSRKPKSSPSLSKPELVQKVLALREDTQRGADTISLLLYRHHGLKIHRSTIHKILKREGLIQKKNSKPKKKHLLRYQAPKPGRIQIDVKYVPYRIQDGTNGRAYQYTAIDDCTRARFAYIYDGMGIYQLENFLSKLLRFFPFRIHTIQTDNHVIFTYKYTAHKQAFKKQPKVHFLENFCKMHKIHHHLIQPAQPELNGKVERSHKTDQAYFYDFHHFKYLKPLKEAFSLWMDYYNHHRPHWALAGQTPAERLQAFGYKLGHLNHETKIIYSLAA
jgi:transposase InsO family protein